MAYFKTTAERQAWVMQNPDNLFTYAAHYNPRGLYDIIQANWPGEFPGIENGAESSEFNMNRMHDFLQAKAARMASPMAFAVSIQKLLPAIVTGTFNSHNTFIIQ